MKKLTVDQRDVILSQFAYYTVKQGDFEDAKAWLNANTEKEETDLSKMSKIAPDDIIELDWAAQPDGIPINYCNTTDKTLVYNPDTGMRHWSRGGWMFSQGFKTDEEAEECQDIRYTKQMIKAMPVNVKLHIKTPVGNSKYPYAHEDWAGINPMYDPYADVELGQVDRYFEDEQGIVDTVIVK